MSSQRLGFPNISIKLYEDYEAWQNNRFLELAATFTVLTIRDTLTGINEGLLQFYDPKNLQAMLTGDEIIQVSVANANTKQVLNRIYGIKHSNATIDEKGDSILVFQLTPYHKRVDQKFGRVFYRSVQDSIDAMLNAIYENKLGLKPTIQGVNVHVPLVPWTSTIGEYQEYARLYGMAVESETWAFVWEDFYGVHIVDFNSIEKSDPRYYAVGEPRVLGEFNIALDSDKKIDLVWDFEFITRNNSFQRNPFEDMTVYAYSFLDKGCTKLTTGEGTNSVLISRSGGYEDQTYRNGYEETSRLMMMSQMDTYAKATTYGDFTLTPGTKCLFADPKEQFLSNYYVDEVFHEITREQSLTYAHMFTNSKKLVEPEFSKEKNELKNYFASEEDRPESEGNPNP
ncbi:baseplate hub subunit [Serratia phage PS2]|uniref:Baseplate hub subunit n=1 Tax=Serratia phage PS2 TaxID=1481112 RepID=A0A023W5A1_9CAUD|nr:baseplate hub [Serratia phage PS2]AHY25519.1 baseplate hub subunit [Serratia phage PS2]